MMTNDARKRFTLRLPSELLQLLEDESNQKGIALNTTILHILWEWVEKGEKQ